MPVVIVSYAPSRELYDAVSSRLGLADGEHPDGRILHAASETEDGRVEIVDVYESAAAATAFESERLFPAFKAAGVLEQAMNGDRPVARQPFEYVG